MISVLGPSIYALGELATRVPQFQEIVSSIGDRRRRQRTNRIVREAGWLGAGLVLGAGLATLLTPISGVEFRDRLSERTNRLRKSIASRTNGAPTPGRTAKKKPRKVQKNGSSEEDAG